MAEGKIFVGRKAELEQFKEVLKNPKGQAVLVVGQAGMGKTWLVNKMTEIAENHPKLKCGWVRYEVTPTDSVDSMMALMMDNAFEAAQVTEGSFNGTSRRLEQWRSLLNVINIGDLVMSLKRDPAKNTREQFLERLRLISKLMPDNGRAIFVIDPEKYMQRDSDQTWAIVVKQLPEKIKFVFAQRPDDRLVKSETFNIIQNVVRIPDERLGGLTDGEIKEWLVLESQKLTYTVIELCGAVRDYRGHPYKTALAIDLLASGLSIEQLPEDPTYNTISADLKAREEFIHEYSKVNLSFDRDTIDTVIAKMQDALSELDRRKRSIVIMLFCVLGLGAIGVVSAIILKRWELIATTGTGVLVLVLWPVRKLINLYKEERPLRVMPPFLYAQSEEEGRKLIKDLMHKILEKMK